MDTDLEAMWPRYLKLLEEGLTPENEEEWRELVSPDFHFRDPLAGEGGVEALSASMQKAGTAFDDWKMDDKGHAWYGREVFAHIPFSCRVKETGYRWEADEMVRLVLDDDGKVVELVSYFDLTPLLESVPHMGETVTQIKKQFAG